MIYSILVKNFDTNTRMSYNSINFLNPIRRLCKKNMSETILPIMINDSSLTNEIIASSSHFKLPERYIKKT